MNTQTKSKTGLNAVAATVVTLPLQAHINIVLIEILQIDLKTHIHLAKNVPDFKDTNLPVFIDFVEVTFLRMKALEDATRNTVLLPTIKHLDADSSSIVDEQRTVAMLYGSSVKDAESEAKVIKGKYEQNKVDALEYLSCLSRQCDMVEAILKEAYEVLLKKPVPLKFASMFRIV